MLIFEQAIKSEVTKKAYLYQLNRFKEWAKIKNFDGLLEAPQKDIQVLLEDYVMYLKKTVSPNSIPIYFAPLELFYVMNDVNLNFKKIRKLFPEKVKKGNERAYTNDNIATILNSTTTKRHRALVLLLASSGCRIGAIPEMRLSHLSRIEESYAIKIYEGDKEETFVFTTPEAKKAIDDYLAERKKDGEYIDNESPLFRTHYQLGIEKVKSCSVDNLSHIMGRLVSVVERKRTGKTKRFDIAKNHGFRKLYATVIKQIVGISSTMTEKLINHVGVVQMDGSYFAPSMEEMFEAYKKAIPKLVFDENERLRIENQNKQERIRELESDKDKRISELESKMDNVTELLKRVTQS